MINVACALIFNADKVLVAQRSASMKQALLWEFPGGKVEAGETAQQCLHREIKEELNIDIEILESLNPNLFSYDTFTIKLLPFICRYVSGTIQLTEHQECRWFSKNELGTLDWSPADVAIVNDMISRDWDTITNMPSR